MRIGIRFDFQNWNWNWNLKFVFSRTEPEQDPRFHFLWNWNQNQIHSNFFFKNCSQRFFIKGKNFPTLVFSIAWCQCMWQTLWFQPFQCEILVIFINSYTIIKLPHISHIIYIEMVEITQFPSLMFTYCQTTVPRTNWKSFT